ncbi:uncharacterized protein LTR77_006907 [Saxophila tyrrhenica]|uniref:Dihydrolipoamide acetyltransferase component of pyruvate dehydrogenase complex n=1 Tax=Saxophila tyrrhenica TaxID=1690608 RepID=A0AAV9P9Z2_9PEZI|nr:hypothetical protein LTR77_006907 [Saxophila tyrrhenica]
MASAKTAFSRAFRFQSNQHLIPRSIYRPNIRHLHASRHLDIVKPFLLADIGEGITECQLIQWFVQPGARVEQFDKICEVQSDKASVEITSPFDGVIKKLHYDPDDMAITGKPLVDIDIEGEISEADAQKLADGGEEGSSEGGKEGGEEPDAKEGVAQEQVEQNSTAEDPARPPPPSSSTTEAQRPKGPHASLATPAVRRITKEHGLNVADIQGTGKDGRVLKEDVDRHVAGGGQQQTQTSKQPTAPSAPAPAPSAPREDRKVQLSNVQSQMFKTMTKALNIPHFLYSTTADMGAVTSIRQKLNARAQSPDQKITHLAFIMKAVSLALQHHPLLNSSFNASDPKKPELTYKGAHNFGIAIDAPSGLLVPVVKNVQDLSIAEIAAAMRQLSEKARNNKLAPGDFSGATFTVSNIGSVGGGVVAPVISEPQVAILGVGRSKIVPAFNENDELIKKEELVFSWSADHRIVDGAECARCAEKVKGYLEDPGSLLPSVRETRRSPTATAISLHALSVSSRPSVRPSRFSRGSVEEVFGRRLKMPTSEGQSESAPPKYQSQKAEDSRQH